MEDREVIQALRWCAAGNIGGCIDCPAEEACDECSGKALVDAADRLEALLAENEHLREATKMVPQWVRVSERLPKGRECVVAFDRDGVAATGYFDGVWHGIFDHNAVTHWMPLPSTEGVE